MGAGDVDFASAGRYAKSTVTPWAVEIAVGLVLILIIFFVKELAPGLAQLKELCIFLLSLRKVL